VSDVTSNQVAADYQTILQVAPSSAYATSVAAQIDAGALTEAQLEASLLGSQQAMYSSLPALIEIDAFYGVTPTTASLTMVSNYATGLFNAGESVANIWSILGLEFAHNSTFENLYSGVSDLTFTQDVYQLVFGAAPTAAIANLLASEIPALATDFPQFSTDDMGGRGALYGALLYYAETNQMGKFYSAANTYLTDQAEIAFQTGVAADNAAQGPELTQTYPSGGTEAVYGISTTSTSATEGSTVVFELTTQDVTAGTQINYTLSGVTAAEVANGQLTGTVTVGADGTGDIQVTLTDTPGEGLSGDLTATISLPSGASSDSVNTLSVPLTETAALVDAATIAAANAANSADIVNVGATGNVSVTIEGTDGLTVNAGSIQYDIESEFAANTNAAVLLPPGAGPYDTDGYFGAIIIQGNANATVTDVDGGINNVGNNLDAIVLAGSGANTVIINPNVTDSVLGGTGSTTIQFESGFTYDGDGFYAANQHITQYQMFFGNTTGTNVIAVEGIADFTEGDISYDPFNNFQQFTIANGGSLALNSAELNGDFGTDAGTVVPLTISGVADGTASLTINDSWLDDDGLVNLTGDLSNITSLLVDDGAEVILGTSDIANLTSVSTQDPNSAPGTNTGVIISTVAGVQALLALDPNLIYGLQDTAANLAAAPASLLTNAVSVALPTGTITIAQAVTINENTPPNVHATYTVSATPAQVVAALYYNDEYSALVNDVNSSESYQGTATVQQAETFAAAENGGTQLDGYQIADTAQNIGTALLNNPNLLGRFNDNLLSGKTAPVDIDSVTIQGGTATVAQAVAIADFKAQYIGYVTVTGSFSIQDSLAGIYNSFQGDGNLASDLKDLTTLVTTGLLTGAAITPDSGAATVAMATYDFAEIAKLGLKLTGGYSLSDTASHLASASPAIVGDAASVTVTDTTLGVAAAQQVLSLAGTGATVSFTGELLDTAANLANASTTLLQDAHTVVVSGSANVAEAAYLEPYAGKNSIAIDDTAANILLASSSVLTDAASITISGSLTVAQAEALYSLFTQLDIQFPTDYTISDAAADIIAVVTVAGYSGSTNQKVLDGAQSVTITDSAITVQQADQLHGADISNLGPYSISDTVKNIVAAANDGDPALTAAHSVAATGAATVQQALTLTGLSNFSGVYTIADSVADIVAAVTTHLTLLNKAAAPVTFTGADTMVTVNQANILLNDGFTNWSKTYVLADDFAALKGASSEILSAAGGQIYAVDPLAVLNIGANLQWIEQNTKGYIVSDTFTNIMAQQGLTTSAYAVIDTDPSLQLSQAGELYALNHNLLLLTISDVAADLTSAALSNANDVGALKVAEFVNVTGPISVATAETLLGLNSDVTFTLSDTGANLAASSAATTVAAASSVAVSGATAAQATTIVGENPNTTYILSDTGANLTAAAPSIVEGASSVSVTNADLVALTAAEVAAINTTPSADLTNWTSSAPGSQGYDQPAPPVAYNLMDMASDLAAANPMELQDAGRVIAEAGGSAVTVAQVQAIESANAQFSGSYALSDTFTDLTAAGAAGIVTGAASVTDSDPQITVAQATALLKLYPNAVFTLGDSAADLTAASAASDITAASNVVIDGLATVAQVQAVEALNSKVQYSLADTAANLAAAPASVLTGSTTPVTITTEATVAQMTAIDASVGADISPSLGIVDTAANVAAASQAVLNGATVVYVLPTATPATAAQGAILDNLTYDNGAHFISYTVSDTAANIAAADVDFNHATSVTATGTATAAQADVLMNLTYDEGTQIQYAVADTWANLSNQINTAGYANADVTSVTVTDASITIADAADLYYTPNAPAKLIYTISDTQDRLVEALGQFGNEVPGVPYDLNAVLGKAQSVSIAGGATISLMYVGGIYTVAGSVAALQALPSAVIDTAAGYMAIDTVANLQANLPFVDGSSVDAGNKGIYQIADSAANITAAAPSFVADAAHITITDTTLTLAQLEAVASVNSGDGGHGLYHLNDVTFSLTDTAANLFSDNMLAVQAGIATNITVTTALTGLQAANLVSNHSTGNTYTITDSSADLFPGGSLASTLVVKGASSVTVTGALTDAQAASLIATNASATYSIQDSPANLFTTVNGALALNPEVSAAQSVSVNGAVLNVAQATLLDALGSKFTGGYVLVDSSADLAAASSTVLQDSTTIEQTNAATVAQAEAIVFNLGSHALPTGFSVTDTAANVATATLSLLTDLTTLTVSSAATAAQAETLSGLTYGAAPGTSIHYSVSDTSANILLAANQTGIADAQSVTATDQIPVATAVKIFDLNSKSSFSLKDVSGNFGATLVVSDATSAEVTDSVNVGEAQLLASYFNSSASYTFDQVSDTVSALAAPSNQALLSHAAADSITVSAPDSLVPAGPDDPGLEGLINSAAGSKVILSTVQIVDTPTNVLQAYYNSNYTSLVTGAKSIAFTENSTATVAQAQVLEGLGNVAAKSVPISDTLANEAQVLGTTPGVLNDAVSATGLAYDNDSGVVTKFNDTALSLPVTLQFTHGGSGTGETITQAAGVFSLGGVDLLTLKAGDTLDVGTAASKYNITDDPANLMGVLTGDAANLAMPDSALAIQGNLSNGGATFTASGSGDDTLLLWSGTDTPQAGVVLVGMTPGRVELGTNSSTASTYLHLNLA